MIARSSCLPRRRFRLLFVCALVLAGGCLTVSPHERGHLARTSMTIGTGWSADQHVSHAARNREGAALADGMSGGGCGCN